MKLDPITAADTAEEQSAAMSLRAATDRDDLVTVWFRDCDHWPEGAARDRLRDVYSEVLSRFVPLARAG